MKRIFLLLICMVLCLSGCSVIGGNNITALMSPPQGSAQYQSVVNKLEQYLSEKNSKYVQNIVYQHPNKGSYRSAIFLCNLNGDEYEDAVIFYRLKNVSNGSNVLFLLGDGENNWSISGAFSVTYREVDNVRLGHIADASRDTVVITWKTYNTLVSDVYEWNGRNIDCLLQEKETTELGISDFDDDGLDEMIVLYQNPYGKNPPPNITRFKEEDFS